MPELLLAIDVGTSTLGAFVFTPGGELLGKAAAPVRSQFPGAGRVEQDADRIWRSMPTVVARALAAAGRDAADLAAIGLTTQRTSLVCWDRRTGRALSPLVVWSDLRGAERARELQQAGFYIAPQQAAAKLEAVLAAIPDAPALLKAGHLAWGNIDAYLVWKMTDGAAHVTDRSQAWPTGYLDAATLAWNPRLLALQQLDERAFPTLVDTWGALGAATAFGGCVPITAIVADQQSALIGQGCEAEGAAKLTYGTSATYDVSTGGQMRLVGPTVPPFLVSIVRGDTRFCVEGMIYAAGSALDWLRRTLRLGDHRRFTALADSVPDSGGVAFLPALQGLGAPHGDLQRRGALTGLSSATTAAHIARAALEGIAFRVRELVDHIDEVAGLPHAETLLADGGLASSDTLMQIQADILGRPVARHALREATAVGAAICAGRGAGLLTDGSAFVRHETAFEPRITADEAQFRFTAWKAQVHPNT